MGENGVCGGAAAGEQREVGAGIICDEDEEGDAAFDSLAQGVVEGVEFGSVD